MVIAVPQILNIINNSRTKEWDSIVKMIEKEIETNDGFVTLDDSAGSMVVTLADTTNHTVCRWNRYIINNYGTPSYNGSAYIFTVTPAGQYGTATVAPAKGNHVVTLTCSSNYDCSHSQSKFLD